MYQHFSGKGIFGIIFSLLLHPTPFFIPFFIFKALQGAEQGSPPACAVMTEGNEKDTLLRFALSQRNSEPALGVSEVSHYIKPQMWVKSLRGLPWRMTCVSSARRQMGTESFAAASCFAFLLPSTPVAF